MTAPFAERLRGVFTIAKQELAARNVWPYNVQDLHDASPNVSLAEAALCYATVRHSADPKKTAEGVLYELYNVLLKKHAAYGSSATEPLRRWSAAPAVEGILIRLDDKLSRLVRGSDAGEDTLFDFCGYLALLEIVRTEETP